MSDILIRGMEMPIGGYRTVEIGFDADGHPMALADGGDVYDVIPIKESLALKVKELVQKIQNNLRDDAEVDFLLIDGTDLAWLDLRSVNMNADVDDPNNLRRGGLTFFIKERF